MLLTLQALSVKSALITYLGLQAHPVPKMAEKSGLVMPVWMSELHEVHVYRPTPAQWAKPYAYLTSLVRQNEHMGEPILYT